MEKINLHFHYNIAFVLIKFHHWIDPFGFYCLTYIIWSVLPLLTAFVFWFCITIVTFLLPFFLLILFFINRKGHVVHWEGKKAPTNRQTGVFIWSGFCLFPWTGGLAKLAFFFQRLPLSLGYKSTLSKSGLSPECQDAAKVPPKANCDWNSPHWHSLTRSSAL